MKKTEWWMKLLILLPIMLLAGLLVWVAADQWAGKAAEGAALAGQESSESDVSVQTEEETEHLGETAEEAPIEIGGGESSSTEITESKPSVLLVGGDVYLSDHVLNAYRQGDGIGGVLDAKYLDEIGRADIFMVNEEFPFSDRGEAAADKQFTFRLPPSHISVFQEIGIDIVTLANNHALDFGAAALTDTCAVLEKAGILYVGAGANAERAKRLETMEVNGKTIGFLGATRVWPSWTWAATGQNPGMLGAYDPKVLLEEIAAARDRCDYLVVYLHWGKEKAERPEDYQRALGHQIIDAGADLVVGAHPHVLQGIEYYGGKPIVYSLGNFIFGSSIPKTALLKVELEGEEAALSLIPGTSKGGYTSVLEDEAKLREFYSYLESLSVGVQIDEDGRIYEAQRG